MRKVSLILLVFVLAACGMSAKQVAEKSLDMSYIALKSAESTWHVMDKEAQGQIVETTPTEAETIEKLTKYRVTQGKILKAFVIAYATIGIAATALALSDIKKLSTEEIVTLVLDAKASVQQVIKLIRGEPDVQ